MSATQKAYENVTTHIGKLKTIQDKITDLSATLESRKTEFKDIIELNTKFNKAQKDLFDTISQLSTTDDIIIQQIEILNKEHKEITKSNKAYIESLTPPNNPNSLT
jgi:cob(I)alamin adenosyltransferase